MARKPATKKGTETVTDTNTTAAADTSATDTTAAPVADANAEGVAWGANADPAATINKDLLASIVGATQGNSFVYTTEADHAPLVAAGYAEVNPGMVDDNGRVATRATTQGIQYMSDTSTNTAGEPASASTEATAPAATTEATAPAAAAPAVETKIFDANDFADIFASPAKRSNSGRTSSYPFETLEVGKFFVVPATADKPDPKKSLASTISSAERRFATEQTNEDGTPKMRTMKVGGVEKSVAVYTKVREFESRSLDDGAKFGFPGVKVAVVRRTK